jgi:hypothetical protein
MFPFYVLGTINIGRVTPDRAAALLDRLQSALLQKGMLIERCKNGLVARSPMFSRAYLDWCELSIDPAPDAKLNYKVSTKRSLIFTVAGLVYCEIVFNRDTSDLLAIVWTLIFCINYMVVRHWFPHFLKGSIE